MSEQSNQRSHADAKPPPPTRAQRLTAFGFLGAFGLTILTVLLTGLRVGAPAARHLLQPAPPAAESRLPSPSAETRSVSSGATPSASAPTPGVSDSRTQEKAAPEEAEREPDGATRKGSHKHADDSRANDAR